MDRLRKRMATKGKCFLSIGMAFLLLFGTCVPVMAKVTDTQVKTAVNEVSKYVYQLVKQPEVGSIGGEWAVIGLARGEYKVAANYYQKYYERVEQYVKEKKGVLHKSKYTEYARVIVALAAIDKDARDVAGYDLTLPLGDYDKTLVQGINGPIWALIALDTRDYPMPQNPSAKTKATRQKYIDCILSRQLNDGGWSLSGGTSKATMNQVSDPDITGMALQALAKYKDQPKVVKAIDKALTCMSKQQLKDGGFATKGVATSESVAQMIVALGELGISLEDERFVKNGQTMLDNLLTYRVKGKGFLHTKKEDQVNQMATEQGLYALVAASRIRNGKSSLYRMQVEEQTTTSQKTTGALTIRGGTYVVGSK